MNCGVSRGYRQRGGLRGRPREWRKKLPARTSFWDPRRFWEPCPPPVLANPAESSPSGSRYLYKYVYSNPRLRVKLFLGGSQAGRPLKNLSSQTRHAAPEKK